MPDREVVLPLVARPDHAAQDMVAQAAAAPAIIAGAPVLAHARMVASIRVLSRNRAVVP
jgi:hypothetical protein